MAANPHAVDAVSIERSLPRPHEHQVQEQRYLSQALNLWHLLSLDAPTVAMLWTWFIARTNHIVLPVAAVLAMGIVVWMLYAADRLLDTRSLGTPGFDERPSVADILTLTAMKGKNPCVSLEMPPCHSAEFEARHYFHRNHQKGFRLAILLASIVLAMLLPGLAPQAVRLYLVLGTLLFGYFVLIHVNSSNMQVKSHRLPKELAVGVFFSAATFIPTIARNPELRLALLPGAILFAVLCSLNCLFIYTWEHPATSHQAHPATRVALRFLPHLAVVAAIAGFFLLIADQSLPWPVPLACAISASLLLLLHKNGQRLSPTTLRAAADLCLLTPLLLLRF